MKIAICDDDPHELIRISQLVDEFVHCGATEETFEVRSYASSVDLITQLESGTHFDVFFLDVMMPNLNGIELATQIRSLDQVAKIVFLTSSSEFAVDSYAVGALHYLLKPIQKDKLFPVIEKACLDLCNDRKQYIVIKTPTSLSKVFLHQLIYAEVIGRKIYFHQKNGVIIESTSTISQVEAVLYKDPRFLKPHRSYIVNLDCVKQLAPNGFTMTSDQFIPVSRNLLKDVKQAYINYAFQMEDE